MAATIRNSRDDTQDLRRKDREHNVHPRTDFAAFKEQSSLDAGGAQ